MKNIFHLIIMAGIMALLAACASMSEKECLSADWFEQGHLDGRNGQPPTRIIEHRKACAKVAVMPDGELYRQGWEHGIIEYCTPANGLAEGRAGRTYRNVCPAELEGEFLFSHQRGMELYEAERRVSDLQRQIDQLQRKLDKEKDSSKRRNLRRDMTYLEGQLNEANRRLMETRWRY